MPFLVVIIDLPGQPPGRHGALDDAMTKMQYVVQTPQGHPLPDTTFVAKIHDPIDITTVLELVRVSVAEVGLTPRDIIVVQASDPNLKIATVAARAAGAELGFAAVEPDA